jgi:uncharacterized protein (DUF2345 family)
VWKNVYFNADGSTSPTNGAVLFQECNELEIIQINIEGSSFHTYGGLLTFNNAGNVTVDGAHFERIGGDGNSSSSTSAANPGFQSPPPSPPTPPSTAKEHPCQTPHHLSVAAGPKTKSLL